MQHQQAQGELKAKRTRTTFVEKASIDDTDQQQQPKRKDAAAKQQAPKSKRTAAKANDADAQLAKKMVDADADKENHPPMAYDDDDDDDDGGRHRIDERRIELSDATMRARIRRIVYDAVYAKAAAVSSRNVDKKSNAHNGLIAVRIQTRLKLVYGGDWNCVIVQQHRDGDERSGGSGAVEAAVCYEPGHYASYGVGALSIVLFKSSTVVATTTTKSTSSAIDGDDMVGATTDQQQPPSTTPRFELAYAKAREMLTTVEMQKETFATLLRDTTAFHREASAALQRKFDAVLVAVDTLHEESAALMRKFETIQRQRRFINTASAADAADAVDQQQLLLSAVYRRRLLSNETLAEALAFFDRPQLDRLYLYTGSHRLPQLIGRHFAEHAPYRFVSWIDIDRHREIAAGGRLKFRVPAIIVDGGAGGVGANAAVSGDPAERPYLAPLTAADEARVLAHLRPRWVRCRNTRIKLRGYTQSNEQTTRYIERLRELRHLWLAVGAAAAADDGGSLTLHFNDTRSLEQRRFDAVLHALLLYNNDNTGGGGGGNVGGSLEFNLSASPLTTRVVTLDLGALHGRCTRLSLMSASRARIVPAGDNGALAVVDFAEQQLSAAQMVVPPYDGGVVGGAAAAAENDDGERRRVVSITQWGCNAEFAEAVERIAEERFRRSRTQRCNYVITLGIEGRLPATPTSSRDVRTQNAWTGEWLRIQCYGQRYFLYSKLIIERSSTPPPPPTTAAAVGLNVAALQN